MTNLDLRQILTFPPVHSERSCSEFLSWIMLREFTATAYSKIIKIKINLYIRSNGKFLPVVHR